MNATGPSAPALLEEEDLASRVPAEDGDDEVEVAIAVEIGSLDVGHSSQARKEDPSFVGAVFPPLEPENTAQAVVGRDRDPEIGDQDIMDPVAVQVGDFGVGRIGQVGREHGRGFVPTPSLMNQQFTAGHLAREDIGTLRVGEVDESDMRDRGRLVRVWSGDLAAHHRSPRSQTVRRSRDDREAIGRRGLVIRDHLLDRRRVELAIGIAVEVEPASDFGIPSSLGKQVGGRISVAVAAKRDDAILEDHPVFGYGLRDRRRARSEWAG